MVCLCMEGLRFSGLRRFRGGLRRFRGGLDLGFWGLAFEFWGFGAFREGLGFRKNLNPEPLHPKKPKTPNRALAGRSARGPPFARKGPRRRTPGVRGGSRRAGFVLSAQSYMARGDFVV